MAVSYSGDKGGVAKLLYVIGPNGDYKGVLPTSASTTQYFNAGGISFAAGASLDPFKSAGIFTNFTRSKTISIKNLSKFDSQFAQKSTKGPFTGASLTGDNKSRTPVSDPRATHRIIIQQKTTTPFATSFDGISHMDEIHFTRRGSGLTLQAFFMGFANGVTIGNTLDFFIGYVGNTLSGAIQSFGGMTGGLGLSLEAKNVKTGGTAGVNTITQILGISDVGHIVISEASSAVFGGGTFGVTFGPSTSALRTAVFPRDDNYNSGVVRRNLRDLVFRSDALARNHACFTNDSRYVKQIFVRSANDNAKLPISSTYRGGITIDGVSGGTNGTSELDHMIAAYDVKVRSDKDAVFSTLKSVGAATTIRELMNVSF
tara:strand:+ start:1308 stop:2423 length:1116 start_codon:yes stop_codon:yes gene_type:complete